MKRVYICHPYSGGEGETPNDRIRANMEKLRAMMKETVIPAIRAKKVGDRPLVFVPHFAFSEIAVTMDGREDRDWAMAMCLEMVRECDEVWVYGEVTMGMRQEIDVALKHSIPVKWMEKLK